MNIVNGLLVVYYILVKEAKLLRNPDELKELYSIKQIKNHVKLF